MRDYKWFVENINNANKLSNVLQIWKEAEEQLIVEDLVKVHAECHERIIESIRTVVKETINGGKDEKA
tara:strand:+ start:539 stop:742 length:204 start_codon:yes stop_codon:yes gene_type:complete